MASEKQKKDVIIKFRVTKEEEKWLDYYAKKREKSRSFVVRELLSERLELIKGNSLPRNSRHFDRF